MRISEIKLNEETRDEKDSHDISVSFSEYGPNININISSNALRQYYDKVDIMKILINDDKNGNEEEYKKLMNTMKPVHENAEKQMVELTNAYVEMLKAIIVDASNKVNSYGDRK